MSDSERGDIENAEELDQKIARVVDGTASPHDMAELNCLLDGNREAQCRYVRYIDLHQELLERSGAIARVAEVSVPTLASRPPKVWFALLGGLAASLLVALGFAISHGWSRDDTIASNPLDASGDTSLAIEESDNGVAVLTRAVKAEWRSDNSSLVGRILFRRYPF